MKKKVSFLVVTLCLTSCSQYISNGERRYLQSKNGVNIIVPPPLTDTNISHFYDLPPQNQNALISIVPPADQALKAKAD
ncbi:hypothetical protein [Legionella fairfieldensis]|uniref:hypothetical protein n=1 Tax=Legionella fairfieldensis TaxID=45064 RepID=UPI0004915A4B|nr:hypothetical protein [Legionella fairfieldensis]